jgi:hypothetical protein
MIPNSRAFRRKDRWMEDASRVALAGSVTGETLCSG